MCNEVISVSVSVSKVLQFSPHLFSSSSLLFVSSSVIACLFIQAHGGALVHAHVSVTEQTASVTLDVFRVEGVQLFGGHFQVRTHFRTRGHLRDVKTILAT